jgi:polysaccharide export outer membrane protein
LHADSRAAKLRRMRHVVLLALLAACPHTVPNYEYAKEPDPRNNELVLGVGDVVGINVWEQKDLVTEVTIRPDGKITMQLVGDLQAAGQTPSVLQKTITEKVAKYIKDPIVTVAVRSWKSYRFTIDGEVTRPGVFSSDQYLRMTDAIAMANGLSRFARRGDIKVTRLDAQGVARVIPIDYDLLTSGKHPEMNIWVLAGDTIHVP